MSSAEPWPAWLHGLIDDAAIFPPGNATLPRAVAEHREHLRSEYAGLLGAFVVPDVKVPDLIDVLDDAPADGDADETPLGISLLVTGGAGAIAPAVRWASRAPSLHLRAIELALRDEDDLAHNARRVLTALDAVEEDLGEVEIYVELPRPLTGWVDGPTHGWLAALDELAGAELRAKFRTGGVTADAFPPASELSAGIDAALDREMPFKCTAGLHHAISHHDPVTGFDHFGFLNLLTATRACLDGGDAVGALVEISAEALLAGFEPDLAHSTRRWFTGFGSCSVLEPHDDLVELGLVHR